MSDSECVSKAEMIGFPNRLNVGYERESEEGV